MFVLPIYIVNYVGAEVQTGLSQLASHPRLSPQYAWRRNDRLGLALVILKGHQRVFHIECVSNGASSEKTVGQSVV